MLRSKSRISDAIVFIVFKAGIRIGRRDTFFCFAKRKYPNKKRPEFRLYPARLAFGDARGRKNGATPSRCRRCRDLDSTETEGWVLSPLCRAEHRRF
jgi:hypothetical protein